MKFILKSLLIILLFSCSLKSNDCIPLTFHKLSMMMGQEIGYNNWYTALMPDGHSALIEASIIEWNKCYPKSRLICIYSVSPYFKVSGHEIKLYIPYLWIGAMPANLVITNKETFCHSAVAIFHEDYIEIISTISEDGKRVYIEQLDYLIFFKRTLLVYEIGHETK